MMARNQELNEQFRQESLAKIISTARHLFAQKGYDACSMSEVAKIAGMSKGNIYWYFPSKEALFKAILVEGFTAIGEIMTTAAGSAGSATEKLAHFMDKFIATVRDSDGEDFVLLLVSFLAKGGANHFTEFGLSAEDIGSGFHQALNAIFAQGQSEGVFRTDMDANTLSTFFFAMFNGLMLIYPTEWREISVEQLNDVINRLIKS
jgi:AcrR family transcriptional regulator